MNSIVKVVTELMGKVKINGASIRQMVEDIATERTVRESLIDELQKKYDALEGKS